jgi:hypothetical protein
MNDLPRARTEGIHTEEIEDGLLVYNEANDMALSLNRTATVVWRSCNGERDTQELLEVLRAELGDVADEDLLRVTIDDLVKNGLVEGSEERDREAARLSRRRFIRRVGTVSGAAVALPVVHAIVAPDPAAAQTGSSSFDPSTSTIFNSTTNFTTSNFTSSFPDTV